MLRVLMVLGLFGLTACDHGESGSTITTEQSGPTQVPQAAPLPYHQLTPELLVGPRPSQEQIGELSALGIQKVISVDALPPESSLWGETIQVRHLPLGYRDIPVTLQLRLAQELSTDPVKTYIHCHHGKHRGPAAALTALRNLGKLDEANAEAWLDRCGVAYEGLRDAVHNAETASTEDIEAAEPLEEVVATRSLSRLMAEIDELWDRLKKVPSPGDPKARTQKEDASQLVDLLRMSSQAAGPVDPGYHQQMQKAIDLATNLETLLQNGQEAADLRATLRTSCRSCHRAFRD